MHILQIRIIRPRLEHQNPRIRILSKPPRNHTPRGPSTARSQQHTLPASSKSAIMPANNIVVNLGRIHRVHTLERHGTK